LKSFSIADIGAKYVTATPILSSAIPGPRPLPILGRRGSVMQFYRDTIGYMHNLHQTYGDVAGLVCGSTRFVFGFGSDYNRLVLTTPELFLARSGYRSASRLLPVTVTATSTDVVRGSFDKRQLPSA
jgi:hypothetical protein